MGYLHDQMAKNMKINGYSDATIKSYTRCMHNLAFHYMKNPLTIKQSEIRDYFVFLIENNASPANLHIYYSAIKLFYKQHGQPHYLDFMPHPKRPFVIPDVLDQSEIELILSLCRTLRYKALFSVIYSAGLRISEAINLKISDIDFSRKMIHVSISKNNKERYTILSDKAAVLLKRYINRYKPISFLFYALKDPYRRISKRHVQHTFHALVKESGISKKAHIHTLRHSFATHLLEDNTNLFYIMQLLGHSSIKSTIIYLHMQRLDKMHIVSPLDSSDISIDATIEVNPQYLLQIA
jgi:integrase/recombinase XerD